MRVTPINGSDAGGAAASRPIGTERAACIAGRADARAVRGKNITGGIGVGYGRILRTVRRFAASGSGGA